jgi:hypothetical protein
MPIETESGVLRESRHIRELASQTRQTAAIAIRRSELLRDRLASLGWEPRAEHGVDAEPAVAPDSPAESTTATRQTHRTLDAHFAVASILVDGEPWPVRYASLDVYHHGPHYEDPGEALWEVQCTTAPGSTRLELRHEYGLELDTRDGRHFAGRVFTQHASSEICTLLDVGEPLVGLDAADYLD